ncbi:hypothetical protein AABB24_000033, partial [Solanum stoloniferum]
NTLEIFSLSSSLSLSLAPPFPYSFCPHFRRRGWPPHVVRWQPPLSPLSSSPPLSSLFYLVGKDEPSSNSALRNAYSSNESSGKNQRQLGEISSSWSLPLISSPLFSCGQQLDKTSAASSKAAAPADNDSKSPAKPTTSKNHRRAATRTTAPPPPLSSPAKLEEFNSKRLFLQEL